MTEHPGADAERARWWRRRPFWGGLFTLLGGTEILVTVRAPLPIMMHVGMLGLAGMLVPIIVILCGLLLWINPAQHVFYAVIAALLTLASWVTSNLGGFFLGMILGLVGAALGVAWTYPAPAKNPTIRHDADHTVLESDTASH
jgi:hypothetical protein